MTSEQPVLLPAHSVRRLALVIGVNASQSPILVPLQFAERDAERMAEVLQTSCTFELFRPTLLGETASTGNVRKAVLELARQAEQEDVIFVYFSGHGQPLSIEAGRQATYLVTADFNEQDVEDDNNAHLSLPWLREKLLLGTKAERVLIVIDSCFSEDIRTPPDRYLEELRQRIAYYFEMPGSNDGTRRSGLRVALAAASYDQTAGERDGSGIMTGLLLKALSGNVDDVLGDDGNITVHRLTEHIKEAMPPQQKPVISTSDAGGYEYVLASYPERAAELLRQRQRVTVVNERPHTYIPLQRKASFQARPDEFETLEHLLLPSTTDNTSSPHVALIGVLGMGGIGKTQLAAEFAHRYKERFAGGVFWMPAIGTTLADWQRQFADLAEKTDYLRADDDITHPENETKRARHLCHYLAQHPDALLILDNVENTNLVQTALPTLAGEEAHCVLLYTSRNTIAPSGVKKHIVERLPVEGALTLLLTHRLALLPNALVENTHDAEGQAARAICQYVDYLPLALTLLRDLLQDEYLTLTHLAEQLQQRGAFEITQSDDESEARLFSTFHLSWDKIRDVRAQRLFKLAAYFPEATAIPLWLLGLASGLGETGNTTLEPLGRARLQLQRWSMIEVLTDQQIRLHPLLREFGRRLVAHDEQKNTLLQEAGQHLVSEFTDINKLEKRALEKGYWQCLEQVQAAYQYVQILNANNIEQLERIERWLARDSSLLSTDKLWPENLPGLFYQQLHNHMIEAGEQVTSISQPKIWIRQTEQVGIEDDTLLREFKHPMSVTCVAYSPDGHTIATGCDDGIARLWDVASGRIIIEFRGHVFGISCLTFSPDGTKIATGADDAITQVWDVASGKQLQHLQGSIQESYWGHRIQSVAFSPNGERIATTLEDGIGHIWDIASGKEIATLLKEHVHIKSMRFTDDNEAVISCNRDSIYLWDVNYESIVKVLAEEMFGRTFHKLLSLNTDLIVVGSEQIDKHSDLDFNIPEMKIRVWNVESKEVLAEMQEPNSEGSLTSRIIDATISPDGTMIVVALGERLVHMWDMRNSTTTRTLCRHVGYIAATVFSPNDDTLVTASEDRTVRLWRIPSIKNATGAGTSHNITTSIRFSQDGAKLATGTVYGITYLWNTQARNLVTTLQEPHSSINSLSFSPDGTSIAIGSSYLLKILDIATGKVKREIGYLWPVEEANQSLLNNITVACFSPDGTIIAGCDTHDRLELLNAMNGHLIAQLEGHRGEVHLLAFSSDETRLVSGSDDGTARIWNILDYTTIAILKNHLGSVTSLCVSPDNTLVATASLHGVVHIWSMQDGKELALLRREGSDAPLSMAFSPDGNLLLVNDRYANTSLWKMDEQGNGRLVGTYTTANEIKAIHWQDTRHVILAGVDASGYEPQFYHLALEGDW